MSSTLINNTIDFVKKALQNAEGGQSKYDAGADLIEIYTGFIYSGPGLVKELGTLKA